MSAQRQLRDLISKAKEFAGKANEKTRATISDRKVQVTVASAAGGTATLGGCGAVLGGAVGIPFALFTFGLSIPFLATVGAAIGGTAGCATGGAAGFTGFTYRTEIEKFLRDAWTGMRITTIKTRAQIVAKSNEVYTALATRFSTGKNFVMNKVHVGTVATKEKASQLVDVSVKLAKDPHAQVTAASAAASGAALGATGGAVGLATGTLVGGAVGVVPAIFTFGLSIPFTAAVGGATGLCFGTTVGGATGAVGGGAVGYGVYGKRAEIRSGVSKCVSYSTEKKEQIFAKVKSAANMTSRKVESPKKVRTGSA